MKKTISLMFVILLLLTVSSCFSTREQLFYLPIEEDSYYLNENLEDFKEIAGKTITFISLSFKDLNKTALIDDDFLINTFGDYSFKEIKVFEIELLLSFDGEAPKRYDLEFLGRANPGRPNAYAFKATIEELHKDTSEYRLVLDLNTHIGGVKNKIAYYLLQFNNKLDTNIGKTVVLRNALQSKRDESLKELSETFGSLKRENYTQENFEVIYQIERYARENINVSFDIEEIKNLIEEALKSFDEVPLINGL